MFDDLFLADKYAYTHALYGMGHPSIPRHEQGATLHASLTQFYQIWGDRLVDR